MPVCGLNRLGVSAAVVETGMIIVSASDGYHWIFGWALSRFMVSRTLVGIYTKNTTQMVTRPATCWCESQSL